MSIDKLLIIGIDGGTWDCFDPACEQGLMPHLQRFKQAGVWGPLRSTQPPITPAAWVAFMTGQHPGHHGVLGFQQYRPETNDVELTSSRSIRTETLWQKLARHGKRVAVVGVPMTYPPLEVDGILVSGFDTPSTDCEFTHPASFKQTILEKVPDFTFARRYRTKQLQNAQTFGEYIGWLKRQAEQSCEILELAWQEAQADVGMILLRSFDELLHHFWTLLDFRCDTQNDPRNACITQYYRDLDAIIGRLLAFAEKRGAAVVIMSDHGGQAKIGNVYPNRLLRELGYIGTVKQGPSLWQYIQRKLQRRKRRAHPLGKRMEARPLAGQLDWARTQAYITEVNIYASLYVQQQGLQPEGIVPADRVQALREELTHALRDACGEDGQPVFSLVQSACELYQLEQDRADLPDLLIAGREGYLMRLDPGKGPILRPEKGGFMGGTHSMNGMFAGWGPDIATGTQIDAAIIDIAPTILAALGLPVTADMDGIVLDAAFAKAPQVRTEQAATGDRQSQYDYSASEQDELKSRLADLGYLG